MAFNQFTNLDFNGIRDQIKDYLRTNTDFSDFDFDGSNFSILIDILAYNTYITAYNTNMAVNEVFLDSATLRENVVSLARNIGYVPRSSRSAEAVISFTVDLGTNETRTVTLKAGTVVLGNVQGGNYVFSIPEDFVVAVNDQNLAIFDNITIYEGIYLTKSFRVDYSLSNQRYILPNPNVDVESIRVKVVSTTSDAYQRYSNILNVDANSKLFLVQEIEDEKYELLFGDNILGKKPPANSTVDVSYIVTNGRNGNGAANFSFSGVLKDDQGATITSGVSLITTNDTSNGGDGVESIDSIKYLAPRVYAAQYRAVTANDYKSIIPLIYTNVETVTAYGGEELDPPEFGKVFISIKPKNGSYLSQITKDSILRQLKQYSIAGIKPELVDLQYLYVEVDSSVYYNANVVSDATGLRTKVVNTLNAYAQSADINSFGGRFKYSKVIGLIDDSDKGITSNITKVRIRRDLIPEFNAFATYELCFGNRFHQKRTGYSIKSSGFSIDGVEGTIYIGDIPTTLTRGRLIFFKLENNTPIIVKNNAGIVKYDEGEVLLDVVNITGTDLASGFVQIEAVPESNDIIALKDLYLQVDIGNSRVGTIQDVVTSGENTSATQYITTSSFLNGTFTR
ncbi:MAG: baseplate wedge protein [Candidatus Marinimicrobia bacterium]|jgi:hypothetical protein|nr:baseplate wedge protein [Candidatus Neomarinimicrobiota bacterium]|tara:strand:- start:5 stop:1873 length:1869 start_codon:yes stop_codon:yes gene_type:complete